jgi:DNA-binding transcriptional MocR family regulator
MVMTEIAQRSYEAQVARARTFYRSRRDAMLAALEEHMPEGVTWVRPEGGLFVWMTLPDRFDGRTLLARAVEEHNVAFVPGSAFFVGDRGRNTIRLSYSLPPEDRIAEGIARLGRLLKS